MSTSEVNVDAQLTTPPLNRVGTITLMSGANLGAVFVVDEEELVIGSDDEADVVLDEDGVSHLHARILRIGKHYEIEDLASRNGTFVAGERVHGRTRLKVGARVLVANCMLRFDEQDPLEAQTAKRVYELSVRDEMTRMYNRRYLDQRLATEVAFAKRQGTALCLMSCDIDFFKDVNDRFGHQAGDQVLRQVANTLLLSTRAEDVLARAGGEEFAVIVRGVDVAGARAFAERMRSLVETGTITWQGQRVPVTISIGIAHNQMGMPIQDAEALYSAADIALYVAKNAGRNRCHMARGRRPTAEISSEILEQAHSMTASICDVIRRSSN